MTELKPCPFCGGPGELYTHRQESWGYYPGQKACRCKACKVHTQVFDTSGWEPKRGHYTNDADKLAADAWNTRAKQKGTGE